MAANAAMRGYMENTLGIVPHALRVKLTDQGLDDVDTAHLITSELLSEAIKNVIRPGGQIANPLAGQPGQPAQIRDPGMAVPAIAQERLRCFYAFARHEHKTQRQLVLADATLANVQSVLGKRTDDGP